MNYIDAPIGAAEGAGVGVGRLVGVGVGRLAGVVKGLIEGFGEGSMGEGEGKRVMQLQVDCTSISYSPAG